MDIVWSLDELHTSECAGWDETCAYSGLCVSYVDFETN